MAQIRVVPVSQFCRPAYPTKLEVAADPDLLRRYVPPGWLRRRELAGALGAFLAVQTAGCSKSADGSGRANQRQCTGGVAIVAPIFDRGAGILDTRYAVLGEVAAVSAYLAEEEALSLVEEELSRHGLTMSKRDVRVPEVVIDGFELREAYDWINDYVGMNAHEIREPLEVDLVDPRLRVAVEYVSGEDYERFGGLERAGSLGCSVKKVAGHVARRVREDGQSIYFGAFYDPASRVDAPSISVDADRVEPPDNPKDRWEAAMEESRRLLRAQVRDFVDWLKAQGVI